MTSLFAPLAHQIRAGDPLLVAVLALLAASAACRLLLLLGRLQVDGRFDRFARLGWQIGAVLGLEQAYEFTRGQIPRQTDVALFHAYRLLNIEWSHHFFIEQRLQRYFLHFPRMMSAIDLFYVAAHVGVTIGVLVWIGFRHRDSFPAVRNMFMLVTAIALIVFYLYPTAPPRLLAQYGFQDPLVTNHLVGAGGDEPGSYTFNPYAAMPSLHVGYALVCAWCLFTLQRSLVIRLLAVLYPVAMTAAVIISGNHWVLDAVGAAITVVVARCILYGLGTATTLFPIRLVRTVEHRRTA